MNARRDPDRLIHAFLLEGQTELPDQVYDAVRSTIERKRQRVVFGPWRTPFMNKLVPIGLGAVAVIVVALVGARLLGTPAPAGPGAAPTASPSVPASPTASPSVAAPSPSVSNTPPPLTETFTSERHGFSITYPTGWLTRPATEPWTAGLADFMSPAGDVFYDPVREGDLWISVASQPIGASTPDEWAAEKLAFDDGCKASEPTAVDGATGLIGADDCTRAAVTTDGRGYFFWLYTGGNGPSLSAYDRAWFEEVLATVQLQPADAVDAAPSASP
jgi:hypothetical protein